MRKLLLPLSLLLTPVMAYGYYGEASRQGAEAIPHTFDRPSDVLILLNTLADWIFTLLLVLAVIFILIAGFHYLTGSGNEEKIKKAHKTLMYAVIAVAVAVLAQGIVFIVRKLVIH